MTDLNDYIDDLIDVMDNIELHKVTILTGRNGGGKSMIRKLLPSFIVDKNELKDRDMNSVIASISMDRRAGVDDSRFMGFDRDLEWLPTSENTFDSIEQLLKVTDRYLILDELELGMGEELQAGVAEWINKTLDMSDKLGVLVITHSRAMVKYLHHDSFVNLEGMSEDEWMNREIVPLSPDELKTKSRELYKAFQKRLEKG